MPIEYRIFEETPINHVVGNLIVDAGLDKTFRNMTVLRSLRFKFLTNATSSPIDLEEIGVLKIAHRLDREMLCPGAESCRLEFDITVKPMPYFRIFKIVIEVLDINDNAPSFPVYFHSLSIIESALIDSSFALPAASDRDSPQYGVRRYRLSPSDHPHFSLFFEKRSGEAPDIVRLILRAPLDYELVTSYQLELFAYDGGSPERWSRLTIDISVVDDNDNNPEFDKDTYEKFVYESQPIGSVIERVTASDADSGTNGRIHYALDTKSQQLFGATFAIEEETGSVVLKSALDFENCTRYMLGIVASNSGATLVRTAHAYFIVNVQDVNDNSPQITVNTLTDSGAAEVQENSKVTTFVAHVTVVDYDSGDGGKVACSINNDDFLFRSLFDKEYELVTARIFDHESVVETEVTLTCFDHGWPQRKSVQVIKVKILDTNDNPPRFTLNIYEAYLEENNEIGVFLLKIDASDADSGSNADIQYSIAKDVSSFISIDPKSGVVRAEWKFDFEEQRLFKFTVIATDNGDPPLTSTALIQLDIIDLDDEKPQFSRNEYSFAVSEAQLAGSLVGSVKAVDADSAAYGKFHYQLDPNDDIMNLFHVDAGTGEITTQRTLDRESVPIYYLKVLAVTRSIPQQTTSAIVVVHVTDVNDNAPQFVFPTSRNNSVKVSVTASIGQVVAVLRAEDLDDRLNAKLSYLFDWLPDNNFPFDIDTQSGAILVKSSLASHMNRDFTMDVVARDQGTPSLFTKAVLRLHVTGEASLVLRSSSSAANTSLDNLLVSDSLTIVLIIVFITVVLCILILVAMVIIIRKRRLLDAQVVTNITMDGYNQQQPLQQQQLLPTSLKMNLSPTSLKTSTNNFAHTNGYGHIYNTVSEHTVL